MGLDLSSAIKLFLTQMIVSKSIPFPVRTVNGYTVEQEKMIIGEAKRGLKNTKKYKTAEEMFKDVLK